MCMSIYVYVCDDMYMAMYVYVDIYMWMYMYALPFEIQYKVNFFMTWGLVRWRFSVSF